MRPRRRLSVILLILALLLLIGGLGTRAYQRGAAFVVIAAGMDGTARRIADRQTTTITEMPERQIPWRAGTLRSRAYQPARVDGRGIVLVPGVHASGIDEPRLVGFARDIAGLGHPVLTVELPDLMRYEITTRSTDMIEDAAAWAVRQPEYRGADGRIGMLGISFGGGLSVVAAGRPAIRDSIAFVMALGGHGDLPRTLKYLCTGIQADGSTRPPHDYGLAIVLLGAAHLVVPAPQVTPLRDAIRSFLEASRLQMVDQDRAAEEFARAKTLAQALAEPSRTYMGYVNDRDVVRLGPVLLPHMAALGGAPALSPERSPLPSARMFLLHGTDDNVVPAIESTLLARHAVAAGARARALLTPLITHAEVDKGSTLVALWRLIDFWSDVLNQ
jgi:dienelactone hydrolase